MQIDLGVLIVLGLNGLAWVWGASRLMRSVESLEKTSSKLEDAVKELTGMLADHGERLARLESRCDVRYGP